MSKAFINGDINGRQVSILEFTYTETLNQFGTVSFSFLADETPLLRVRGEEYRIYVDGQIFVSGVILKRPQFVFSEKKSVLKVDAVDEIGRLSCIRAKSDSHYQDTAVVAILTDLLSFATGWVLDTTTMIDPAIVTTIDLRGKETLWAQLVETVRAVPDVHLRHGGLDGAGNHILEVGAFNTLLYTGLEGVDLVDLTLQPDNHRVENIVEAFGGFTPARRITLDDALNDGRALVHPDYIDYPIITDAGTGTWYTEAQGVGGCEATKKFELTKPKNEDAPTQQEIDDAGYALWLKSVRYLKQHSDYFTYETTLLRRQPLTIGDRIHLSANVTEKWFNPLTMTYEKANIFAVNDDYQIMSQSTKLDNYNLVNKMTGDAGHIYEWSIQVSEGEADLYDSDLEMYERLEKAEGSLPTQENLQISPLVTLTDNFVTAGAGTGDCNFGAGVNNGVLLTFTPINQPNWATQIRFAVQSRTPSNLQYEVTTYDINNINADIEICVTDSLGDIDAVAAGETFELELLIWYS